MLSDTALSIRDIFNTLLPGTEQKDSLRFTLRPRFGDFSRRDYLRMPMGVRYGLTEHWEGSAEVTGYLAHGFGSEDFGSRIGFSEMRVGTKYNFRHLILPTWDTSVAVSYNFPVSSPPAEIVDGLTHLSPSITFSRRLESRPAIRVFVSTGLDLVSSTNVEGTLQKNAFNDDLVFVNGGFVWDRDRLHYTFETTFSTTRLIGEEEDRDMITLRPGVIWDVPARWTPGKRGGWIVGAGLRTTFSDEGTDVGASLKLRVDFNLKEWWRRNFPRKSADGAGPGAPP